MQLNLIQRQKVLINQSWLKDFAGAWIFYTVLPKWPFIKAEFHRIARFAPLIGFFLGIVQSSVWLLLTYLLWPKEGIVLFVLAIGFWLTGGLHVDGLMDTADGIAAGEAKCLEAMRDSRVGASGVQLFIIVLLLQIAALTKLGDSALFAIPIATFWGRASSLWAIGHFPYLHESGSGYFHKLNWKGDLKESKPSLILIILFTIILIFNPIETIHSNQLLIISLWLGILPTIIIPNAIGNRLKGHTGDSYGASVVLVETFILILLSLIL